MTWLDDLAGAAPITVNAFRAFSDDRPIALRRAIRGAARPGAARQTLAELAATAAALAEITEALPEAAFREPGGEEDWNVAQALAHAATSRAGLALAASLAADGRWPAAAPAVVPGVPGPADATRAELVDRVRRSQRLVDRTGAAVVGHEADACPLDHPLVGRLRCGEWLAFAAVHDVMHLEQLHRLATHRAAGVR